MANKTGWNDFHSLTESVKKMKHDIERVGHDFSRLKAIKDEIFDDPERKAEAKKVADVHPEFSIAGLTEDFTKLKALNDHLIAEGFYKGDINEN